MKFLSHLPRNKKEKMKTYADNDDYPQILSTNNSCPTQPDPDQIDDSSNNFNRILGLSTSNLDCRRRRDRKLGQERDTGVPVSFSAGWDSRAEGVVGENVVGRSVQ